MIIGGGDKLRILLALNDWHWHVSRAFGSVEMSFARMVNAQNSRPNVSNDINSINT